MALSGFVYRFCLREVTGSRPEPWTAASSTGDPALLSVGQPEAPVRSKVCLHGSFDLLLAQKIPSLPTLWVSGAWPGLCC